MTISRDTLKAMIRDFQGFDLSDEELEIIRPELETYLAELEILKDLDLCDVMSARLLQAKERGDLQ